MQRTRVKEVPLPLVPKRHTAQVSVRTFNLSPHFNPRDLQTNLAGCRYGGFFNSVDRRIRGNFVVEF